MITHHRQAMEMSALVTDRSTDPDLNTGQGGRGEAMKGMVDARRWRG
jgi:hypothetical protein